MGFACMWHGFLFVIVFSVLIINKGVWCRNGNLPQSNHGEVLSAWFSD